MYETGELIVLALLSVLGLVVVWVGIAYLLIIIFWPRVKWKKGRLYIQRNGHNWVLFSPITDTEKGNPVITTLTLASFQKLGRPPYAWATIPKLGYSLADASNLQRIRVGGIVIRRRAHRKDLLFLMENWDNSNSSLKSWVEQLPNNEDLTKSAIRFIQRCYENLGD